MYSIDELPDPLLIHILSFLNVNEAAITSVLSKRWQFLWTESPSLVFRAELSRDFDKLRNFVNWVNRAIVIRRVNYLEEFSVNLSFNYTSMNCDVSAWVEYAMKSKVKKLCLGCLSDGGRLCTPPQVMYSSPFLTNLHLQGCYIHNLTSIEWPSLTHLHLHQICFHDQRSLDQILSTCPLLCNLCLQDCYGLGHLEINSPSLHTLSILESQCTSQRFLLKISAPRLHTLYLYVSRDLHDVPSLVRADIAFEMISHAIKLLRSISHVKELYLGFLFFEVASMMTLGGWELPQSRRELLVINCASQYEHNISGIIGLLESSPNLETLVIEGCATAKINSHLLEHIVEPAAKDDLVGDLLYLKTIKFRNSAYLKGKQILKLARILLKRATALEEMVITTDVKDSSDFEEMSQTILTFPRSSTKAVVHIVK